MTADKYTETHLNKDELLEILNEIDTERQYYNQETSDLNSKSHNPAVKIDPGS